MVLAPRRFLILVKHLLSPMLCLLATSHLTRTEFSGRAANRPGANLYVCSSCLACVSVLSFAFPSCWHSWFFCTQWNRIRLLSSHMKNVPNTVGIADNLTVHKFILSDSWRNPITDVLIGANCATVQTAWQHSDRPAEGRAEVH